VRGTVSDQAEVDEELRYLCQALASGIEHGSSCRFKIDDLHGMRRYARDNFIG